MAGKTGTSQVVGRAGKRALAEQDREDDRFKSNSLFLAFAPAEDPQVSVIVLVEGGGAGSTSAAPVAKKILEFYDKEIEPLNSSQPLIVAADDERLKFRRELNAAFGPSPAIADIRANSARGN